MRGFVFAGVLVGVLAGFGLTKNTEQLAYLETQTYANPISHVEGLHSQDVDDGALNSLIFEKNGAKSIEIRRILNKGGGFHEGIS